MIDANQELQARVAVAIGTAPEPSQTVADTSSDVSKIVTPSADVSYSPLQTYYGIDEVDEKTKSQLQDVWDYYKNQEGVKDTGDILKAVRAAHMNMVQPEIGQTKLSQLADYVRIIREMNDSKKQKEAYERLRPK